MKKTSLICLILSFLLAFGLPASATESLPEETQPVETVPVLPAAGDASVAHGCRTLEAQIPLYSREDERLSAGSAMLYEVGSGTMVYADDPDEMRSPSSLVKIMTLLLAVERGNLDNTVSVTMSALSGVPSSALTVKLQPGERMSLRQLLHCMMVGSGNDAAAVAAEYISGSQAMFVAEMNRRAAELGCTSTNFTNAHGLHDDDQYTTARDMCRILAAAMENEAFMEFFGATSFTVPATNMSPERKFTTNNNLMLTSSNLYVSQVTGGRTGVTNRDGRCLASMAEGGGMKYVAVVLDSRMELDENSGQITRYGNFEDTRLLYSLAFEKMKVTQVLSESQVLAQYPVRGGRNHVAVGTNGSVTVALPADVEISSFEMRYSISPDELTAPIALNQKLSDIQLWLGDTCVAQADMVARNSVPVAQNILVDTWTAQSNGPDLFMMVVVILVIAAVLVLTAGTLAAVRRVQASMMRGQRRRRRRDRRRSR